MTETTGDTKNGVRLIFLNCCSFEKFDNLMADNVIDGFLPTFEERISMENLGNKIEELNGEIQKRFGLEIDEIHFVDQNYLINRFYTDEGKHYFNTLRQSFLDNENLVRISDCRPDKFFENLKIDNSYAYMIVSYDSFLDEYHFFNYLDIPMNDNIFVCWNLRDIMDVLNSKCFYDAFKADIIDDSLDCFHNKRTFNPKSFKALMEVAIVQTEFLKNAGFLDRERFIQKRIPAWTLNIECAPFSSGIIIRYGLYPEKKYTTDGIVCYKRTVMEHFQESADYRYQILDIMCRVIAKHMLNFGAVRNVEDWQTLTFNRFLARINTGN